MPEARFSQELAADGGLTLRLEGHLDVYTVADIWPRALAALSHHADRPVTIHAGRLEYCDGAGIGLLVDLLRQPRAENAGVSVSELPEGACRLLAQFDPQTFLESPTVDRSRGSLRQRLSDGLHDLGEELYSQIMFIGEVAAALAHAARHPRAVRWRDALLVAQQAGVSALPIVGLIGFLMGVILAFQSAVAMRQFGAEIFVANLLALSLFRELGPLMTAILLAGRSASAFAAEIGTMKVNEEIDALTTMGLDPVRFLVVTRVLAAAAVTPLLTIFANFAGLLGGGLVMMTFDVPAVTYLNQVAWAVTVTDFAGGLVKAFFFALLVAGVGCLRGLQTGTGAAAVGISTTRAVVGAIILIVLADGLFAVLYYHLDI